MIKRLLTIYLIEKQETCVTKILPTYLAYNYNNLPVDPKPLLPVRYNINWERIESEMAIDADKCSEKIKRLFLTYKLSELVRIYHIDTNLIQNNNNGNIVIDDPPAIQSSQYPSLTKRILEIYWNHDCPTDGFVINNKTITDDVEYKKLISKLIDLYLSVYFYNYIYFFIDLSIR